jgi:carbamoyltransferase
MAAHLNDQVKHREAFRSFAPAVLEERAHELFADYVPSPFMLQTFRVRPEWADAIPAVVHVDRTARAQGVTRDASPLFHRLIERFAARTGVPAVLNTSLNVRGEPIAETPDDALRTFGLSGLEDLILGDLHVRRPVAGRARLGAARGRIVAFRRSA